MPRHSKTYSPSFKFQLVVEALAGDRADAELARAYGVHPVTLSKWKQRFREHGPEIFSTSDTQHDYEQRIAELERLLGQKEVELALLKNFLGGR